MGIDGVTNPTDKELVRQFKKGDKSAFEALVRRHQRRVFNLVFRVCRHPDEANDLTQEVFVRVYKKLHTFEERSAFTTWLYQVAVNHAKNRLKYLGRRHYYQSESLDKPIEGSENTMTRQIESTDLGPDQLLAGAQIQKIVQEKLSELADDQKMVVIMRDIQGLDYEEIAEITGLALGTVKSRIHRGRVELKKKLEFLVKEGSI